MFINEYGNRNDPTVILLAPMMISGSDLYGQMSQFFQDSYHIIAPDQGLHGKAIPVYILKAELTIRPVYQHCGYMAAHPKEYVEEIERFIRRPV